MNNATEMRSCSKFPRVYTHWYGIKKAKKQNRDDNYDTFVKEASSLDDSRENQK